MGQTAKTDADRLRDAEEIIRHKNNDILALKSNVNRLQRDTDTAEEIRRVIFQIAEHDPEPPVWVTGQGGRTGFRGAPVTMWTDWHYGEIVDPDQVGGVNKYNSNIATKRAKSLVDITIDLSYNHMGKAKTTYPGIVICLGGDMISGNIHEELTNTNDRTNWQAVNDLTDLLASCIDRTAEKFGKVFLACVVGNHGRGTIKFQMKNRVYTSFDWSIYCNLARHFRKSKHIQFMIPSDAD